MSSTPRRRRILRWLFVAVGILLILAIGVRLALPGMLRSGIESRLSEKLGLEVVIERIGLSVTGGRLSLEGIRVRAHEDIGARDALVIGRLAADIRWLPLLSKHLDVQSVELHDVDFLALREEGGARNIGPLLERLQADEDSTDSQGGQNGAESYSANQADAKPAGDNTK